MLPALILASFLLQASTPKPSPLNAKVVDAIDRNYLYAETDAWKRLRSRLLDEPDADIFSIDRQLASLHDGDLRIITPQQMLVMQAETAGEERGVGLVDFALTVEPITDEPKVVTPLVDSPAFKAGLRPEDVILAVNGRPTRGLIHEDVMALLRGDAGTLKLKIRRGEKQLLIDIPKSMWQEQPVVSHRFDAGKKHFGYVGIRLFTPDTGQQTRQVVATLVSQGVEGCIVDLRNNPGGYLDAMAVAGSAFTEQTLGWKVRRDGKKEAIHAETKPLKTMRLVVLINEGTASAAEVLASGLRDSAAARLVGSRTYGRGQIQTYVALDPSAGIVIPAAGAESVRGIRFNKGAGISPEILVRSVGGAHAEDAIYRRAIALLVHG